MDRDSPPVFSGNDDQMGRLPEVSDDLPKAQQRIKLPLSPSGNCEDSPRLVRIGARMILPINDIYILKAPTTS